MSSLTLYNRKNGKGAKVELSADEWLGAETVATIQEIPPRKKEPSLKKVAAYCRVSTKASIHTRTIDILGLPTHQFSDLMPHYSLTYSR